jgi:hypothetical protein
VNSSESRKANIIESVSRDVKGEQCKPPAWQTYRVLLSSVHLEEISATDNADVLLANIHSLLLFELNGDQIILCLGAVQAISPGTGVKEREQVLLNLEVFDDGFNNKICFLDSFATDCRSQRK